MNLNYGEHNSGIEDAEIKRALLFKKNHEPFRIIFKHFNPLLHFNMRKIDIDDNEILNVFDFYQESINVPCKKITKNDIDFGVDDLNYKEESENNRFIVTKGNLIIGRINYFDSHYSSHKQVKSVEIFDGYAHLYRVDFYDFRGFLTKSEMYTPDNKIADSIWYSTSGKQVIDHYYRYNAIGNLISSGWKTTLPNGNVNIHSNYEEVFFEFLNLINEEYFDRSTPNIYIVDRAEGSEEMLPKLESPSYNVIHLHNSHTGNSMQPDTSIMNDNYEYILTNANNFDAIITPSKKQSIDVKKRFKPSCEVLPISVGIIKDAHFNKRPKLMKNRKFGSVIATARIAEEKQIDQLVKAVGIARQTIPEITLDIYGYIDHSNNDKAIKKVNRAIKDFGLEKVVTLHGYVDNVDEIQSNAQIYGVTSTMEGLSLASMGAISNGDVEVSYNINYGTDELLENGLNGYIVPFNDYEMMGNKMVDLLSDVDLLQDMSDASFNRAKRFSETNVWKSWNSLLKKAETIWPKKIQFYHGKVTHGLKEME
ncbi:glycosyltransferase [Apilactobacillus xinyiensis]|uniref:glycosyltransferase n=1 Tax=Apilactobacillus xinyiensis TaxID=2841032 RepID=UPI00200F75AB|nr:glycosyltransferase [Apilactobacillus xinyiensis]MCL0330784.1 glycosyltransferase [Apilactobacillus xinyiensis]